MYKKGDKGSLQQIPLEGDNGVAGEPLNRMENKAKEMRLNTQWTQLEKNSKVKSICSIPDPRCSSSYHSLISS